MSSSTPPSKEWMTAQRVSTEYLEGVASFLSFAKQNCGGIDWHCCPCVKCHNVKGKKTLEVIAEHLICDGIDESYTRWIHHGEPFLRSCVKREDRENFVDTCSTEDDKARREKGKYSRQKIKNPHTFGTREAARTVDELVCGRDGKGRVQGMGSGVSKTTIRASAPYKETVKREEKTWECLESKVEDLSKRLAILEEKMMASSSQSSEFCSASQVRRNSPAPLDSHPTFTQCLLKNFRGNIIALGRIHRDAAQYPELYSVIIDDIYKPNSDLYQREGTLGDVTFGDTIIWPKCFVKFI